VNLKVVLAVFALIIVLIAGVTYAVLSSYTVIPYTGKVIGVGVSSAPSSLVFSDMVAGGFSTCTTVLSNTGNINEVLSMTSALPSYLTLSWNCTGTVLAAGVPQTALFILSATAASPIGAFNFTVIVTGTQT
jgi:hypothetical protein